MNEVKMYKKFIFFVVVSFLIFSISIIFIKKSYANGINPNEVASFNDEINITYRLDDSNQINITSATNQDNLGTQLIDYGSNGTDSWIIPDIDGIYKASFAGWKLSKINNNTITDEYIIPDNDYIYFNDEPFKSFNENINSLEFIPVYGKTIYVKDQYELSDITSIHNSDNEIKWITGSTLSSDSNNGSDTTHPVATLEQAYNLLDNSYGGEIVILNHSTISNPNSNNKFVKKLGDGLNITGLVTLKGYNSSSQLYIDNYINDVYLQFYTSTKIKNLNITSIKSSNSKNYYLSSYLNKRLIIENNVNFKTTSNGNNWSSLSNTTSNGYIILPSEVETYDYVNSTTNNISSSSTTNLYLTLYTGNFINVSGEALNNDASINNIHYYIKDTKIDEFNSFKNSNNLNINSSIAYINDSIINNIYNYNNIENGNINYNNVVINNESSNTINNIYLGNKSDDYSKIKGINGNINFKLIDGKITNLYGGSPSVPTVTNGNINIETLDGTITNLYGGGYGFLGSDNNNITINLNITNTTVDYLYGGGYGLNYKINEFNRDVNLNNDSFYTNSNDPYYYNDNHKSLVNECNTTNNTMYSYLNNEFTFNGSSLGIYPILKTSTLKSKGTCNLNNYQLLEADYLLFDAPTVGTITIELNNSTIRNNFYGGGNNSIIKGTSNIEINSSTINNFNGGGKGNNEDIFFENTIDNNKKFIFKNSTENAIDADNFISEANTNSTEYVNIPAGSNYNPFYTSTKLDELYLQESNEIYLYNDKSNNLGSVFGNINIEINNSTLNNTFYGASTNKNALVIGNINVTATNTSFKDYYGGGNNSKTIGNITTTFKGTTNNRSYTYYGAGYGTYGIVRGDVTSNFENTNNINNIVYGAGKNNYVYGNVNVITNNSKHTNDIYCAGNGINSYVTGLATCNITNSNISNNTLYIGGNNNTAFEAKSYINNSKIKNVYAGNKDSSELRKVNLTISGDNTLIDNLYGYSKNETKNSNSSSTINIVGGIINTIKSSEVLNIGIDASTDNSLEKSSISITNSITGQEDSILTINANGYDNKLFNGSISDFDTVEIKNYGNKENPYIIDFIEKVKNLTINKSYIELLGTINTSNKFQNELFSLSKINNLVLKDESHIYLQNGTNLVKSLSSYDKDDNLLPINTTNYNRIYIYSGKNMKIATLEDASGYGQIKGITYLGMYINDNNQKVYGIYDYNDDKTEYTFDKGIYVMGLKSSDINSNGFVTNTGSDISVVEPLIFKVAHVWQIGELSNSKDITLKASSHTVIGKHLITDLMPSEASTTYQITDIDYSNLNSNINIIKQDEIPTKADNLNDANNLLGISISFDTDKGWTSNKKIDLIKNNLNGYVGENYFTTEYANTTPKIEISLKNPLNLTREDSYGTLSFTLNGVKQQDLEVKTYSIKFNLTIEPLLEDILEYEGNITSGKKYEEFTTSKTIVNTESSVSALFSISSKTTFIDSAHGIERKLLTDTLIPDDTRITLLDLRNNKSYYYIVTGEENFEYNLSDFKLMNNTTTEYYNNNYNYYYNDLYLEEFIFIFDFSKVDFSINTYFVNKDVKLSFVMNDNTTDKSYSLCEEVYDTIKFKVIRSNVTFDLSKNTKVINNKISNDEALNVNIETNISDNLFKDTTYQNKKLGMVVSIYKKIGDNYERLNLNDLFDKVLVIDNNNYYPNMNGKYYVILNDNVINISKEFSILSQNKQFENGDYKLQIELVSGFDKMSSAKSLLENPYDLTFSVENKNSTLNIELNDKVYKTSNSSTLNGNEKLEFNIKYLSNYEDINVRIKCYKKDTNTNVYKEIDLMNVINTILNQSNNTNEYILFNEAPENGEVIFDTKLVEGISTGSYMFEFYLYNNEKQINSYKVQMIIIE